LKSSDRFGLDLPCAGHDECYPLLDLNFNSCHQM